MESFAYSLMKAFDHNNSVEILFGENIYLELPKRINRCYKRILFVCSDGAFYNNYVLDKVKNTLIQSGSIISEILNINQSPTMSTILLGVQKCINNNVDCIIALGEGFTIDAAKLIALESKNEIGSIPVITIPTTSSTGSEISNYAIMIDENTKENHYLKCDFPSLAIMDPTLTTTPVKLAIWDAMNILSHIFDFYFNNSTKSELEGRYSEHLIQRTIKAIEDIIQNPNNLKARDDLMWCASISRVNLTQHPSHNHISMISKSFSSYFNIHHGACLGVLTPIFMHRAMKINPNPFARFARNIFSVNNSNDFIAAKIGLNLYINWLKKVGAPNSYTDISNRDFDDLSIKKITDNVWKIYKDKTGMPYQWKYEDILEMLMSGKQVA